MNTGTWRVRIDGSPGDLEHLGRHFTSETWRVLLDESDDRYVFESESFNALTEAQEVLNKAEQEVQALSGVLKILRGSHELLRIDGIYRLREDGKRDYFLFPKSAVFTSEFGEPTITVTDAAGNIVSPPSPPPRTVRLARLAASDAAVSKVLRLLASPDASAWVGMYRVHEVIEHDLGGLYPMQSRGWGSAGDLKRFKHSANSVKVGGDSARHGKEVEAPPMNPMTLPEAEAYLNYVVQAWLTEKGAHINGVRLD